MTIIVNRQDDGTFTIRHKDEPFQDAMIYVGTSPDRIDQPVARASGTQEVAVKGLDGDRRYYFAVIREDGERLIVAERRLPLEGSLNFRDLGGYQTTDGRHIKWGRVYRSDALDRLTDGDLTYLNALGINLICDFRSDPEVSQRPTKLTARQHERHIIKDDLVTGFYIREKLESGDASDLNVELMKGSYRRLLDTFPHQFGAVLKRLADEDNLPALFHCTAGKDRTGLTAAMLLTLLGVPLGTIRTDYDLTNEFVKPFLDMVRSRVEAVGIAFEPLLGVFAAPLDLLDSALAYLDSEYGGIEAYLRKQAAIDDATIDALKANLLE